MSSRPEPGPFIKMLRHPILKDSRFLAAVSLALPGGSILAYAHFWETRWLEVTRHTVVIPGWQGRLRVLQLSDLHITREDPWHRAMLERVAAVPSDLLVLTGDLTMPGYDRRVLRSMLAMLPRPALGRVLVPGNWEYWSGLRGAELELLCRDADLALMINESRVLPGGLTLGSADSELGGHPDLERLFGGMDPDRPALVLTHCPSLFPRLDRDPVRLVLSGHTHGGQVRLPGLGAPWLPRGSEGFDQGWFQGRHARLFVNRGFGTSLARLRFLCRPEAAVLELVGDSELPGR